MGWQMEVGIVDTDERVTEAFSNTQMTAFSSARPLHMSKKKFRADKLLANTN
jgi:hypothetical protein